MATTVTPASTQLAIDHTNIIIMLRDGRLVESTCPRELFIDLFKHLESRHGLTKLLKPSTKLSKIKDKRRFHRHD